MDEGEEMQEGKESERESGAWAWEIAEAGGWDMGQTGEKKRMM